MADLSSNPLVMDVARRLLTDGRYVARVDLGELETGHLQAIVDLRWTARQAAQLIGRSVKVTTTRAEDEPGAPLVLTAVLVDR